MHGLTHARHRNIPKVFEGRSSRVYDFMSRRVLRRMYRRFAADVAAVAPEGGAVLDVGTGPGVLLVELAARRPDLRLTGVDLSTDMITAATRNLRPFGERASAHVGDVTSLPFPDRSFDLIVSSLSLHHWDHPEAAVPELARVLRPGGRIYIYDFPSRRSTSSPTPPGIDPSSMHVRRNGHRSVPGSCFRAACGMSWRPDPNRTSRP